MWSRRHFSRERATNLSTLKLFAMFLSSCVIAKFDQEKQELSRISRNVLTGIFWTIANISLFLYRNTVRRRFKLYHFSVVHLCIYYGRDSIIKGKKDQDRDDTHDNWSITVFFSNFGFKSF